VTPHDRVVRLRRDPAEVHRARRQVEDFCDGMAGDLRSIAQLLTSELVTNALAHGTGEIQLQLGRDSACLRVAVRDGSGLSPRRQAVDPMSTGGRGLLLLEQLAWQWGTEPDPPGKLVWFTLRAG
jgi:anti-sigma regulatory factor (Ser/Thr protein kinase)